MSGSLSLFNQSTLLRGFVYFFSYTFKMIDAQSNIYQPQQFGWEPVFYCPFNRTELSNLEFSNILHFRGTTWKEDIDKIFCFSHEINIFTNKDEKKNYK